MFFVNVSVQRDSKIYFNVCDFKCCICSYVYVFVCHICPKKKVNSTGYYKEQFVLTYGHTGGGGNSFI